MKTLVRCALIAFLALAPLFGLHAQKPPEVPLYGSQLVTLNSSILGEKMDLYIGLPRFYEDTAQSFPVIYLLDGQWDFPLVTGIIGGQYYDGFMPGVITVGITWSGPRASYDTLRADYYTPTKIADNPLTGNGPKYLAFLKKEVIPYIESHYRAARNERTLVGSSLGGLFTLYAMFTETATFNRYILTSPANQWDNGVIYRIEKEYAAKHADLPATVFMGVGGYEPVQMLQSMIDQVKSRNYKGLTLTTRVMEGMGHSGAKPEGFARGFQAVFAHPEVAVDPAVLDQYTGVYEPQPGMRIRLMRSEGRLMAIAPDSTKIPLDAVSPTEFHMKGQYLFLRFQKGPDGKVQGFKLDTFGGSSFVKKESL